jgi:hypothetical protein
MQDHRPDFPGVTAMRKKLAVYVGLIGLLVICIFSAYACLNEHRDHIARVRAAMNARAANDYHLLHHQWPARIDDLTGPDEQNGGIPWISRSIIADPWGKPYEITPPTDDRGRFRVHPTKPDGTVISSEDVWPKENISP